MRQTQQSLHTQKVKVMNRGRVSGEQPSSAPGPRPASVLVLSVWLAPAVAFLSGVLRVNGSFLSSILICIPSEKDSELRAVMVPFFRLEINK